MADLNKQLFDACKKGDIGGVRRLLNEKKVDSNLAYNNGFTLLHMACLNQNLELAKLLISNGADPNLVNNYGRTPLHYSCKRGNVKMAELLIGNGANQNLKACDGKTAWDLAVENGHQGLFLYLNRK
jgi:ankyrin repeat protein